MKALRQILWLLALAAAAGCSTSLTVTKVTSANRAATQGLRYSLPKPFLLVTPDPEILGGYQVEVVYLPDNEQTYAIAAESTLGSYTLNVETKDGLLEKVEWVQSTADVAAEAARVTGELAKAELERRLEKREEAAKEAEERAAERKTLDQAVAAAKLEHDVAETELKGWNELRNALIGEEKPVPLEVRQGIRQADAKVERTRLVLEQAQAALDALKADSQASQNAIFNDLAPGAAPLPAQLRRVYGPVFYEIDDQCDPLSCDYTQGSVSLTAVAFKSGKVQERFATTAVTKPPPPMAAPVEVLSPEGQVTIDFREDNSHTQELVFSGDVFGWHPDNSRLQQTDGAMDHTGETLAAILQEVKQKDPDDGKRWTFKVSSADLPAGEYALSMIFFTSADKDPVGEGKQTEAAFNLKVVH